MATTDPAAILDVLHAAADAVRVALDGLDEWGLTGTKDGQYETDLAADEACLGVLADAGYGWLSEESGVEHPESAITVIVDPVDGSTNASQGIPWFATSLCAVDEHGPVAALVVNQASGRRFQATRGGGAFADGHAISPSKVASMSEAIVGLSGYPPSYLGWKQFRALGAAALDLCAVAEGVLDAYLDCSPSAHGSWDHAAGALICAEAGAVVGDAFARDLVPMGHLDRRTPVAAGTLRLFDEARSARRSINWPDDPS